MFSRKEYEKEIQTIKQQYKGKDSKKLLLLQRIEDKFMYYSMKIYQMNHKPSGIYINKLSELTVSSAIDEVFNILKTIPQDDMLSNIRYYINTPYYSRVAKDNFPCYSWKDRNVDNKIPVTEENLARLNIIVRCYRSGDVLGFHTDRDEFGENICGLMLKNTCPENGLLLINNKKSYMFDESTPYSWMLTNESRWDWKHGYVAPKNKDEIIRISITFRYYNKTSYIPSVLIKTEGK